MTILSLPSYEAGLATGDSNVALPGTGTSGPPGIEAILEFNGVYFNVRSWLETYLITSIDGLHDADVRDTRENSPAQHGETAFDAFYGGRTIVLTGKIRAYTLDKLRDMQMALRQAFAPLEEMSLIIYGKTPLASLVLWCRKSQPISMGEEQRLHNSYERDFQVTLRASNPRFTSILPTSAQIPQPQFATGTMIAINNGNFEAQPLITFSGQMTAPELHFDNTGDVLDLSGNIGVGETVFVDIAKSRMINDAGVNVFNRLDINSDWPVLLPGTNILSVVAGASASSALITVEWRHTVM